MLRTWPAEQHIVTHLHSSCENVSQIEAKSKWMLLRFIFIFDYVYSCVVMWLCNWVQCPQCPEGASVSLELELQGHHEQLCWQVLKTETQASTKAVPSVSWWATSPVHKCLCFVCLQRIFVTLREEVWYIEKAGHELLYNRGIWVMLNGCMNCA